MNDRIAADAPTWRFSAFDTWFFRESRPMESIGGSELASVFPPPAPTIAGAVRTAVGEKAGVDWSCYRDAGRYEELHGQIGIGEDMGCLALSGPWLARAADTGWQRLYPAPLNLLGKLQGHELQQVRRFRIGPPCMCDLGDAVCLPAVPDGIRGLKPLVGYWVTAATLTLVLRGLTPDPAELIHETELFRHEPRLGIARDNRRHSVAEGMLYQTAHIRPGRDLAVEVEVAGLPKRLHPVQGTVRLGGEGRAARFEVRAPASGQLQGAIHFGETEGLILLLLTPLAVSASADPCPLPGFRRETTAAGTRWRGQIGGIPLSVHCAVLGRGLRQGGWDLVGKRPRPVRTLIPPGSLFYATLDEGDPSRAAALIDQTRIGEKADVALGRGHLITGVWPRDETDTETR